MPLFGVDLGTSGCKAILFDLEGQVLASAYKEYSPVNRSDGYELQPDEVWEAVQYVLYHCYNGYRGNEITALSITSFGEAAVPIDKNGKTLGNSILYTDPRGSRQAASLKDQLGEERIMALTGLPVHSMYTINKILWIKENQPDLYTDVWKFLLFQDYIIYRLTGETMTDYSLASRTMAFNIIEKQWEPVILEACGMDSSLFAKPYPSGTAAGYIKKAIADKLGLPYKTIVATGGHDQACAALGAGILSEGEAVEGIGTADCITTAYNHPNRNKKMLQYNFNCEPHAYKDMYISLSFASSGGALLKWYRDQFGAVYLNHTHEKNRNLYQIMDSQCPSTPTELLVLPHFCGSGTPYLDNNSSGTITGLTLNTTVNEFYRALMEGVAYEMRLNIECLEDAGIFIHHLRAVGGGARSSVWLQIRADIMGRSIETLQIQEAGILASAVLAGHAANIYPSIKETIERFVKPDKVYYPNEKNTLFYESQYKKYRKMYDAVKSIYHT